MEGLGTTDYYKVPVFVINYQNNTKLLTLFNKTYSVLLHL